MSEQAPSAQELTKKQRQVFEFIKEFRREHLFSPTLREIQEGLGLNAHSVVSSHVSALIALGYLEKQSNAARSLRILKENDEEGFDTPKEGPADEVPLRIHLAWLKKEHDKRQADESLSKEAAILRAALQLLDQTDEKQV